MKPWYILYTVTQRKIGFVSTKNILIYHTCRKSFGVVIYSFINVMSVRVFLVHLLNCVFCFFIPSKIVFISLHNGFIFHCPWSLLVHLYRTRSIHMNSRDIYMWINLHKIKLRKYPREIFAFFREAFKWNLLKPQVAVYFAVFFYLLIFLHCFICYKAYSLFIHSV